MFVLHNAFETLRDAGSSIVSMLVCLAVHNRSLVPKGVTPPKAVLKVTSVFGPGTSVPSHKATGDRLFGAQKSQKAKTARVLGTVPKVRARPLARVRSQRAFTRSHASLFVLCRRVRATPSSPLM